MIKVNYNFAANQKRSRILYPTLLALVKEDPHLPYTDLSGQTRALQQKLSGILMVYFQFPLTPSLQSSLY